MSERTCIRCGKPLVGRQKKFCSHLCANRVSGGARSARSQAVGWKTCDIADCEKPARDRTAALCKMHYHRLYRYGTLERTTTLVERGEREPSIKPANQPGDRFGTLVLVEWTGKMWLCQCDCGETRTARTGDLNRYGDRNTCGVKANHLQDAVEYAGAHSRVRIVRGSASQYQCVDCKSPALHWSYDHQDPDERYSQTEIKFGMAYSLKIEHYEPRCVPCHKRMDLDRIKSIRSVA